MSLTLGSYLRSLVATARWNLAGAFALIVLYSATEGNGIALLLPTLQVAGLNLEHQCEAGRYTRIITAAPLASGLHPQLPMLLAPFVILVGMRALLGDFQTIAVYNVVEQFGLERQAPALVFQTPTTTWSSPKWVAVFNSRVVASPARSQEI
jgi:hypothetical protein